MLAEAAIASIFILAIVYGKVLRKACVRIDRLEAAVVKEFCEEESQKPLELPAGEPVSSPKLPEELMVERVRVITGEAKKEREFLKGTIPQDDYIALNLDSEFMFKQLGRIDVRHFRCLRLAMNSVNNEVLRKHKHIILSSDSRSMQQGLMSLSDDQFRTLGEAWTLVHYKRNGIKV